ncbi:Tryptophan aminotransferase-related protein 4 [Nymphaea thermarum]|nr:Tryptophan aminotransferase-related protein 4 [Nymphaea thermarum]
MNKGLGDMAAEGGRAHPSLLLCSLSLNLILASLFLRSSPFFRRDEELTWSREAAAEAEAAATVSCSGHGRAFLDGDLSEDGSLVCDCNSCYAGADCSEFLPDCPAEVNSGDPLFLEPFWMKKRGSSAIMLTGWHRMSYSFGHGSGKSARLERAIRELHKVVGNAVTDGRFIVFGHGSTQLFTAAVHALSCSPPSHASPAKVVSAVPYYGAYQLQTDLFKSGNFEWQGDAYSWKINRSSVPNTRFVEFVTSPNNPDAQLNRAVLKGPNTSTIHDHAYYWPHFTAIREPADDNVMLFTMSKLTGHAGSRLGWAIVKDKGVFQRMMDYVNLNTLSVSHDSLLRALKLLNVALEKNGSEIFRFGYETMRSRWLRLERSVSRSERFSLQRLSPHYCKYFQRVSGPSPAYAWVRCEREEDRDCAAVMTEAGIIGRAGIVFGADPRYVRLSLLRAQDNFDLLEHKLQALVAQEEYINTI